jgi:hypothetical protein
MRSNSCTPFAAACLCSLLLFATARAADYWPIEHGVTWNYGESSDSLYPIQMGVSDGVIWLSEPNPYALTTSYFRVNADGDIEATRWVNFYEYGFQGASFDPPLLFLDLPLEVGKTWETVNSTGGLRGAVLREEVVTVPAGTFQVMVVRITDVLNGGLFVGDYYLDRNIGNVKHNGVGLFSVSGTIAGESQSWGSLKALFR